MANIPTSIETLLGALRAAGYEAYPVGGCVRDSLMGRVPADWDLCTSALPAQTEAVFAGYRLIETGLKHGTVAVLTDMGPVEITTFRTDGAYADGRHPDAVTFVPDIREDLARRDFTVNAMALAPDGTVIDPFGGREDLADRVIRCVGEPDARFHEDGLRILRALRFASKLDFAIEPATARSVIADRALLDGISRERVLSELKGLLMGPGAGRVLRDFAPVLFQVIPELAASAGFEQHNPYHIHDVWTHTTMAVDASPRDEVLRLTMLLHDVAKPEKFFTDEKGAGHFYGHAQAGAETADRILRRLKCDNETRRTVVTLIDSHDIQPPQTPRAMRRLLAKVGEERVRQLLACWRADQSDRAAEIMARNMPMIDGAEGLLEEVLSEKACLSVKSLAVNGRDILALGVKEGPEVGRVLEALFALVLDGALPDRREELLAKAAELAAEGK